MTREIIIIHRSCIEGDSRKFLKESDEKYVVVAKEIMEIMGNGLQRLPRQPAANIDVV